MPTPRMSMRKLKEVLRLKWACGLTHRQISRAIGISVGAVSKFAAQAAQAGLDWTAAQALSDDELEARLKPVATDAPAAASRRLEPDYPALHCELRRKGVTLQLLWEEYVEGNSGQPTCRYTQFCQKYKDWAASLKRSMRQQHRAGEKLFADFAGPTVPILARDGGIAFQAHVFVAVLGASNSTFACATHSVMINDARQAADDAGAEITLGADKGYDAQEFIEACQQMKVTPHVAQNTSGRRSSVPETIALSVGYAISQQKRKLIEQGFGWAKTVGRMRQVMVRGLKKVDQMFVLNMAAYNLVRLRSLAQVRP